MKHRIFGFILLLLAGLIVACGPNNGKDIKSGNDSTDSVAVLPPLPYDTVLDASCALISGMQHESISCLKGYDTAGTWKSFAKEMDTLFAHADKERLFKMKDWAGTELVNRDSSSTVFYPFSGPDFLSAHCMYPNANEYIMIGLEPVGGLPDLCKMENSRITASLNAVKGAMYDLLRLSFFRTKSMKVDMNNEMVTGTTPVLVLFIKRSGHQIVSIRNIVVDSTGKWQYADQVKGTKLTPGVRIEFINPGATASQAVMYFSTDISNDGLDHNPGFSKFLNQLPPSFTYLKAASYLMHKDYFSSIRDIIFGHSFSILQDDSGIAFRYFDQKKWNTRLYGNYTEPIPLFISCKENDLAKAYVDSVDRPLPFSIGYKVLTENINMLYATHR